MKITKYGKIGKTRFIAIKVFTYLDVTPLFFMFLSSIWSQFVRKRMFYNNTQRNKQRNK